MSVIKIYKLVNRHDVVTSSCPRPLACTVFKIARNPYLDI